MAEVSGEPTSAQRLQLGVRRGATEKSTVPNRSVRRLWLILLCAGTQKTRNDITWAGERRKASGNSDRYEALDDQVGQEASWIRADVVL